MEYQKMLKIFNRLETLDSSMWTREPNSVYTDLEGLRFYLSVGGGAPRTEFQDSLLVGEGENSEVANFRLSTSSSLFTFEVKNPVTQRLVEIYIEGSGAVEKLYRAVTKKIEQRELARTAEEREREAAEDRAKLDRIVQ